MRILATDDVGKHTKVYDRNGDEVENVTMIDTVTHEVEIVQTKVNADGIVTTKVRETHVDDDHVTHFEPVKRVWKVEGWTYAIAGPPRSPL